MLNFLRKIPTPCYGNFGGGYRSRKNKEPIDLMDSAFKIHDEELENIQFQIDLLKDKRKVADLKLKNALKNIAPESFYARLYRCVCLKIF